METPMKPHDEPSLTKPNIDPLDQTVAGTVAERSTRSPEPDPDTIYPNSRINTLKKVTDEFARDMRQIYREESQRIRQDLNEKSAVLKGSGWGIATGALIILTGLQAIVATAIIAMASVMAWWIATLVVAIVLILVGMGVVVNSKSMLLMESGSSFRAPGVKDDVQKPSSESTRPFNASSRL